MTETKEERSARLLRELEALAPHKCADPATCRIHGPEMTGCAVCGEHIPGQRYAGQLCSAPCRAEQRKRTREANKTLDRNRRIAELVNYLAEKWPGLALDDAQDRSTLACALVRDGWVKP